MKQRNPTHRIAYFISPHGFGHAARAAAIMAALLELEPTLRFEVFTKVPVWFFASSLGDAFNYHPLLTDIGLVQQNSLAEDLPETLHRLDDLLPFDPAQIEDLATTVNQRGCRLVMCDIAPMGLAVARVAGLPGVLIENFTWDWIYRGYEADEPRISQYGTYLQGIFNRADYHIQTEPVCFHREADLTTEPVSREIRTPANEIRQKLGIPERARLVLVTMGGSLWRYTFLEQLAHHDDCYFILPGSSQYVETRGHLVLLPHHSEFFHPDLVNACDAVVGKIGYSTVAEAFHAGVPYGYIARPRFQESQILAAFIERQMKGLQITESQFQNGDWLSLLPDLLARPRIVREGPNGADQVASFIRGLIEV